MSMRFFKLSRLTNLNVSISKCGKNATVNLPGFSLDDFNRVGGIAIWRILHWFTSSRISAFHTENGENGSAFLEYDKMTSQIFIFMASTRTTVEDTFYKLLEGATVPSLSVKIHLGYLGTSSLNTVAVLCDANSGSTLARNVNQVVCIDKVTRQPTPIPDWWKRKYESFVVDDERLILPLLETPDRNFYKYSIKVSWNDIDTYGHVNYQSFVQFCFDAAMDAVDKKFYLGFQDDILNYDVKSIESAYRGELQAGDSITVFTWQNTENQRLLHFSIRKDEKLIFHSSIEFFK